MASHTRRKFLGQLAATTLVAAIPSMTGSKASGADATTAPANGAGPAGKKKMNVLFLMSDDMRVELGCYDSMFKAKTPNIDALAHAGVRFDRNFCQFPLCNPSRASLFTGRKPGVTGVLGNRTDFRTAHADWTTLQQVFIQNGYVSVRAGKIFHGGIDDKKSWNMTSDAGGPTDEGGGPSEGKTVVIPHALIPMADGTTPPLPAGNTKGDYSDRIIALQGNGEGHGDYMTAERTIANLRKYKDQPFFMGCGFVKPHSPPTAPQKFLDMYDPKDITLTPDFAAWPTVPAGFPAAAIRKRNADLFIGRGASEAEAKEVICAYLASISWCDWNIGRVIAELDKLGLRENTIIVFAVDHGYQLGEKGKWSKAGSLFEMGTRVPLIIHVPGMAGNGTASTRIVESLDIYPTLMELCGFKSPEGIEGTSLVPLLQKPDAEWNKPAYSVWSEDGKTYHGVMVRTEKYRYAEYGPDGKNGAMLFDCKADPLEMKNLAQDPAYAEVVKELSTLTRKYATIA